MTRQAWLVLAAAIAGLALAVGLAVLTSNLTAQHVGLAGEPSRPASGLVAPVRRTRPPPRPARRRPKTTPATTPTVTAPPVTVTAPPVIVTPTTTRPSTTTISPRRSDHEHGDD